MTLFTLLIANLKYRKLSACFNVALLAGGIALILTLSHVQAAVSDTLDKDLRGIDLVVSGKGSPLQIILSTVFHLDIPTGNISVTEAEKISKNKLVRAAIPLALGDNYNGFRIVGTDPAYIEHYNGKLKSGRRFLVPMEVVLGADVARRQELKLGDKIVGAHGLTDNIDLHSEFPYTVVGILEPAGNVLDRLVLTPVSSVWNVHDHPDADEKAEPGYADRHKEHELTALLISYKSPLAAAQLPLLINKSSAMQAASPAYEFARLLRITSTATEIMKVFGMLLLILSAFGFFVTLTNALHDREYDIALMRALGATRRRIVLLILSEVMILAFMGLVFGILLSGVFYQTVSWWLSHDRHIDLADSNIDYSDLKIFGMVFLLALGAAILPAIRAYNFEISRILQRN